MNPNFVSHSFFLVVDIGEIGVFGWRESLGIEGKMTGKKLGAAVEALNRRRFQILEKRTKASPNLNKSATMNNLESRCSLARFIQEFKSPHQKSFRSRIATIIHHRHEILSSLFRPSSRD